MTADEYVPDEEQVRAWCRDGTGDYPDVMDEWIDRFLARVRRDAWDECAQWHTEQGMGVHEARTGEANPYRETGDGTSPHVSRIRRLIGSPTTGCGRGPCCLGDGHDGDCRL